jgi:polyisoprenoid-binding protein YceI
MEMKLTPRIRAGTALALALAFAAVTAEQESASETCYQGGAEQGGQLEFRGAVDGTGFSGRFEAFSVRYCMPVGKPEAGAIEVQVELASADSRNRDRDEALLGEEFFDVDEFPLSTWTSSAIERVETGYRADGELDLKGVRAKQAIVFELTPDGESIRARGRFVLDGSAEVDRQRFAVGTGEFADPEFVRDRIELAFEVELQQRED